MKKGNGKKLLAVLLVIMLAIPASLAAFAEETVTETVFIFSQMDEEIEEKVDGDVKVEDKTGIDITAKNESSASAEVTGNVTSSSEDEYATAVTALARDNAEATVTVGGDVSAEGFGADGVRASSSSEGTSTVTVAGDVAAVAADEYGYALGVGASSHDEGTSAVTVGDITSSGTGVEVYAEGGSASVTANGNIEAGQTGVTAYVNPEWNSNSIDKDTFDANVSGDPDNIWSDSSANSGDPYWTTESWLNGNDEYQKQTYHYFEDGEEKTDVYYYKVTQKDLGGSAEVVVNGNITATNTEGEAFGVNTWTNQDVTGADIDVTVSGNVTVTGTENQNSKYSSWSEGVRIDAYSDADIDVRIGGNVTVTGEESAEGVSATACDDSVVTVEVGGDVKVTAEESADGVSARTQGGTIDVSVGDITSSGIGLAAVSQDGDVTVTAGNVTSGRDGVQANLNPYWNYQELTDTEFYDGIGNGNPTGSWENQYQDGSSSYNAYWDIDGTQYYQSTYYDADGAMTGISYNKQTPTVTVGTVNVTVNGDVNAVSQNEGMNGVWVGNNGSASGTINVTVTGDVNAKGIDNGSNYRVDATGVGLNANEGVAETVTIGGNVSAVSDDNATGVRVGAYGGTIDLTVGGDVSAQGGTGWDRGVSVYTEGENAAATVQVGNVTSDEIGVQVNIQEGTAEVTTGNITASDNAIQASIGNTYYTTLTKEEFDALNLGDPNYSWDNIEEDGTVTTTQEWELEDGTWYHTETRDGNTIFSKNWSDPSTGSITLNINGSVTSNGENGYTTAVSAYMDDLVEDGEIEINIAGDVSATAAGHYQAEGVRASAGTDSNTIVDVGGDVTVMQKDGGEDDGWDGAIGIEAYTSTGLVSVTVAGDVDVTSLLSGKNADTTGIEADTYGEDAEVDVSVDGDVMVSGENAVGIAAHNYGGKVIVDVDGNVVSDGTGISFNDGWYTHWEDTTADIPFNEDEYVYSEKDESGKEVKYYKHHENNKIYWYTDNGDKWEVVTSEDAPEGDTQITVGGDVTAKDVGAYIEVKNDTSVLDILIDGTLSGETSSILVNDDTLPGNVTLTVWEVKENSAGNLAERETWVYNQDKGDYDKVVSADTDFEKQIQYIIRVDQPSAGATLSTSGTTSYEGYDVANEGDTVILKINVEPGYYITGAYNGTDTKVELLRDANGQYYLVVPRGGAVLLSVTLGHEVAAEAEEEESAPAPAPVVNNGPAEPEKMDDAEIATAVEELLTKNDVIENSTVEVKTDASGAKTVVISPEEIGTTEAGETESEEAGEAEEVVLKMTVPAEMLTQLAESDVQQISMVSKSGTATVSLDVAAALATAENAQGAKLVVNIEENSAAVQKATEALPAKYTAKAGAVTVTARIVDEEGNVIVLDKSANITIQLNIDFEEGMKIVFVDADGNVTETEAVWVEATDDVPGHWEVPFMGEGSYIPVVEEAAE